MPRTSLSATQVQNLMQLESGDPWRHLIELDTITGPTIRLVNNVEDVTFNSNLFQKSSFRVPTLSEHAASRIQELTATLGNVTQEVSALSENEWPGQGAAFWTVKIWRILLSVPNDTPLTAAEVYNVIALNFEGWETVQFGLRAAGFSGTRQVPSLSVTRGSGFQVVIR